MSYMAAIRQAHLLRGLQAQALSETMVKAALKGLKNKESLKSHDDLATFGKARDKLKSLRKEEGHLDHTHLPLPWELSGVRAPGNGQHML